MKNEGVGIVSMRLFPKPGPTDVHFLLLCTIPTTFIVTTVVQVELAITGTEKHILTARSKPAI